MAFVTLQILVIAFALFAWSRALLQFKDNKMRTLAFLMWSVVWIGAIGVVLVPEAATWASDALGIQRPVDVLVYGGIVVLFYLVYRLYVLLENQRQETTKLVRAIAMLEPKNKKK
jgi:hypothetical protein